MRNIRILLLTIFLTVAACCSYAWDNFPQTYRDIAVDNEAVWMATHYGLEKYDKASGTFDKFSSDTYNNLLSVAVSPDGDIAVGCEGNGGVATFDGATFQPLSIVPYGVSYVTALAYADGLWIGNNVFIRHKYGDVWKMFDSPDAYSSIYRFNCFAYDTQRGKMWFGVTGASENSIGYINRKGRMDFIDDFNEYVNSIYLDKSGKLYIASSNGMYVCENKVITPLEPSIVDLPKTCTAVTGNGETIWFSANKTLVRYDGEEYRAFTFDLLDNPDDYIKGLVADGKKVWIMMAYGGLFEFKDNKFSEPTPGITDNPGTTPGPIIDEDEDKDNTVYRDMAVDQTSVWLATANGLVEYNKETSKTHTFSDEVFYNLSAIAISPEDVVTVGAKGNAGVATFEYGTFHPMATGKKEITDVSSIAYGNGLWIGSENQLQRKSQGEWKIFDSPDEYSAYNQYTCLTYDETTGNMWIGAYSTRNCYKEGYVDKNDDIFFSESPSYNVNDIYIGPSGHMYLATEHRLLTDNYEDNLLYPYLLEIYNLDGASHAVTGDDNTIWFTCDNTLVQCTADGFETFECTLSEYPKDYIEKLVADGDTVWVLMAYGGLFEFKDNEFSKVNLENTGVVGVEVNQEDDSRMYDLFGRIITAPANGQVYIQNGKKCIGR